MLLATESLAAFVGGRARLQSFNEGHTSRGVVGQIVVGEGKLYIHFSSLEDRVDSSGDWKKVVPSRLHYLIKLPVGTQGKFDSDGGLVLDFPGERIVLYDPRLYRGKAPFLDLDEFWGTVNHR